MKGFKRFLREDEAVRKALKKLPKHHRDLVKGFDVRFESGKTLHGVPGSVGMVEDDKKRITIAAPWAMPRDFVLYHEVAHMVFHKYLSKELRKEWSDVAKKNKDRKRENEMELFCHAYAAHFAKYPPKIHSHPEWAKFIDKICKVK